MAPAPPVTTASLALAIGVAVVAALLALRQRHERREREPDLDQDDARHFARQDSRRRVVVVVMLLLAMGVAVGARIEPKLAGRANPWFVATWFVVFALVFVLLWLALLDWVATWRYGLRHRRAIARERQRFLSDEARRRAYRGNGRGDPANPQDGGAVP